MAAGQTRTHQNGKAEKSSTRDKILKAARKVFAEHPYNAASIRMIGKTAEIEHPLVNYYFPTKSNLFQMVLEDIAEENYQATQDFLKDMDKMKPYDGFNLYLDRLMAYNRKQPHAFRVLLLNMVQAEHAATIPGFKIIQDISRRTAQAFKNKVPLKASEEKIERFTTSFNSMVINYLGAQQYYAEILGMPPGSDSYAAWVKETLVYLFLPHLRNLIRDEANAIS